jgi:hypothetical protein
LAQQLVLKFVELQLQQRWATGWPYLARTVASIPAVFQGLGVFSEPAILAGFFSFHDFFKKILRYGEKG